LSAAPQVNIISAGFKANPFPLPATLRASEPVYRTALPDGTPVWLLSRYEDVNALLRDERFPEKPPQRPDAGAAPQAPPGAAGVPPAGAQHARTCLRRPSVVRARSAGLYSAISERGAVSVMGNRQALGAAVVAGFVGLVCFFALTAGAALAQQGVTPGPPPPGNRDPFAEARERQQREAQLRSAEMLGEVKLTDRRSVEAAVERMKDDFRRIQILRNDVVRHLQSGKPLDYKFIARETDEINKRAGRLKTHLLREAPGDEKKGPEVRPDLEGERLTGALVRMCRRIDSFTENPLFKIPEVIDVKDAQRAGRDLRDILQLSEAIGKAAERLEKTSRN
jgi:hypothetical protein